MAYNEINIKNKFLSLLFLLIVTNTILAQGKYAGEFKEIIGTKYIHENEIVNLEGFQYSQGKILGEFNSNTPYYMSLNVFTKGKIAVVILDKLVDTQTQKHAIIELIKINDIPKNHDIRISSCSRKQGNKDEIIVAIALSNSNKYAVIKKAFALKDIRFEEIATKGVRCLNNEMD